MQGERYVVKRGDCLWRIAALKLGGGKHWPRIWKYNNRPEVIRITRRGIPNPDLIYIGQILLLPKLPGASPPPGRLDAPEGRNLPVAQELPNRTSAQPERRAPATPSGGNGNTLSDRLPAARSPIAFKYRLDDLAWPPQDVGTAIITVKLSGDLLLLTKKAYPITYVTSRGEIEHQVTKEMNHALGKLISDSRFLYDSSKKRVVLRSMLVSQSNTPGTIASAIGVEMGSDSPLPKLRAEIRLPKLEGSIDVFHYTALDIKFVLEITPKPQQPPGGTSAQPLRQPVPVTAPAPGYDWAKIIGIGLIATAGVIVIGTVVEDFLTAGAGVADDPASFSLAGASLARGLSMVGAGAAALPLAKTPAKFELQTTVTHSSH